MNLQPLSVTLPLLYLASAILHGMAFGGNRAPQVGAGRVWMLRITIALHAVYFGLRWKAFGSLPLLDAWTTASAVALCITGLYAAIARWLGHPGTGGIVLGFAFCLQFLSSAFGSLVVEPAEAVSSLRSVHVATSVLASAALVVSGIHGVLYLLLYRQMRQKKFGPLFQQLPDLSLLALMTRRAALAGFLFLTIGLNVGIWWAHDSDVNNFEYSDPHVLMTLALWLHFGVISFSSWIRGFNARRASWAAAAGLVALLFTLAVTLLPDLTFHNLR